MKLMMSYAVVGASGLIVDLALFSVLHMAIAPEPLWARSLAFVGASLYTWWGNRYWTFSNKRSARQSAKSPQVIKHLLATSLTFALNLMIFDFLVHHNGFAWPQVALILATAITTVVNFCLARYWVFSERKLSRQFEYLP